MTIRPGQSWGQPYEDADGSAGAEGSGGLETAADDASLAAKLLAPEPAGYAISPQSGYAISPQSGYAISPQSGDVLRTLGLAGPRTGSQRWKYPIDVAKVTLTDGAGSTRQAGFVAHLSVRNKRLSGLGPGLSVVLLNAPWMGRLRLGPRAHLNDGRLDLVEGVVGFRQRFEATRRARTGSHLPHPQLTVSTVTSWSHRFDKPTAVWLDDVRYPKISHVEVQIVADAGHIVA